MTGDLFRARCPLCWSDAPPCDIGKVCGYCGQSQLFPNETPLIRYIKDLREMSSELVIVMRLLSDVMEVSVPDPEQDEKALATLDRAQDYFEKVRKDGRAWRKKMRERCMGCQLPVAECMCMVIPRSQQWNPKA